VRKDRIGDTSEVVLFHYDERELIEALDTNYLEDKTEGRSDDYYYFESDTTSFHLSRSLQTTKILMQR